jgi:carbamoyl-phosphate synthase large subunit
VPAIFVKAPVFPFSRFAGVDPILGPEMKSTGEVMGIGRRFGTAFAKAWMGAGGRLPTEGKVFLTVHDRDKDNLVPIARSYADLGFQLAATGGTADHLSQAGLEVETLRKVHEGHPHVVDALANDEIALVVNTPLGRESHIDDSAIRQTALRHRVPCVTTLAGARAAAEAIGALKGERFDVRSLQELHAEVGRASRRQAP